MMGHELEAYIDDPGKPVAEMRRSCWDGLRGMIYIALDAEECYAGESGTGERRTFTERELNAAELLLWRCTQVGIDVYREASFVRTCIAAAKASGKPVTIHFG